MILSNNLLPISLVFITYFSLLIAIIIPWFSRNVKIPLGILGISVIFGLISGVLGLISLLSILVLGGAIYYYYRPEVKLINKIGLFWVILILSILIIIHKIPGYNNLKLYDDFKLSHSSAASPFWINFDKPLIGFFLLLFAYKPISNIRQYKQIIFQTFPFLLVLTLILATAGLASNYIVFDPKLPNITLIWMVKMLFFTCVVEELLFRFFLQNSLIAVFKNLKYGRNLAIILAAIIFAAIHFPGGILMMILAFVAGIIYSMVYIRTGYIEAAILLHFLINLIHFLFFSYPYFSASSV